MKKELEILSGRLDPDNSITYVPRWPLIFFLCSAIICLSFSATFHLMQAHSIKTWSLLLKLDYGGICILIMGSCYPLNNYIFACEQVSHIKFFFLALITVSAVGSFLFMLIDKYSAAEYKWLRGLLFVILGISCGNPFVYLALVEDKRYLTSYSFWPWGLAGAIYIIGAFINVKSIPEKFYPRTFDLIGSSHQIFHMCVVIACAVTFEASF